MGHPSTTRGQAGKRHSVCPGLAVRLSSDRDRSFSPDMLKAALIRQDSGRLQRVLPDRSKYGRTSMMTSRVDLRIPAQRPAETPCPPFCSEDHSDEAPGTRSHWGIGASVHLPDGTILLADVNARDGMPAEVVLHDSAGYERRVPVDLAIAYGEAILAAARAGRQAVQR